MYPNFVIRTNELAISVCCLNFAIVYVLFRFVKTHEILMEP